MGQCVATREGTPNPSDNAPNEGEKDAVQIEKKPIKQKAEDTLPKMSDTNSKKSNRNRNPVRSLTQRKDYTADINAMKKEDRANKNTENDTDGLAYVEYEDDGQTIKTKTNGAFIDQYGNRRYDEALVRDKVLDDILIT